MQSLSTLAHYFYPQRSNNYRPKLLHPDTLLVLSFVVIGFFALVQTFRFFPTLQSSVLGFVSSVTVEEVIEKTNQERLNYGLKPLRANPQLSAAALAKAQDMLDQQYWAHTSPSGKKPWDFIKSANYNYKIAGENLARDFSRTTDMIQAWMASPTHQANILNAQYEEIGIAIVHGRLEGFDTALVVQMFATPVQQVSQLGDSTITDSSQPEYVTAHNPIQAVESQEEIITQDLAVADSGVATPNKGETFSEKGFSIEGILNVPILSPLRITKILFLAVIMMVVLTLIYDSFIIGNKKNMRIVGKNFGHILLLGCVAFLVILFRGGVIK